MQPFRSITVTAAAFLLIALLLHAIVPSSVLAIAMQRLPLQLRAVGYKYGRAVSASPFFKSTLSSFQHRIISPACGRFQSTQAPPAIRMTSTKSFIDVVKGRRSIYALNKDAPVSDDVIEQLVNDVVLNAPSFFNTQTTRIYVLLKAEHDKFWDITGDVLKPVVPEDQWEGTQQKLGAFKAGYGTILFYEDPEAVLALSKAYPIYAHHMPTWSEHTSAIHQYLLWAGLEAEGFGANLQHYHPVIDAKVAEEWKVPGDWKLTAQLVFGGKAGEPKPKESKPLEGRVFVLGK